MIHRRYAQLTQNRQCAFREQSDLETRIALLSSIYTAAPGDRTEGSIVTLEKSEFARLSRPNDSQSP